MKKILILFFIFFMQHLRAQNLITNPSFENYSALPNGYGQYNLAIGWENCSGGGTPEYFNTLGSVGTYFGTNLPHTGDGMAGICPYHGGGEFREYLSTQLSSPMVNGQTYTVSFWIASGINGGYGYGCNNVGVNFSVGPLVQTGLLSIPVTPQFEMATIFYDTIWTQFSFQYTATSSFDYFTIGNFRDDANTSIAQFGIAYDAVYYFIDDIDVEVSNQPPVALFNAPHHICPGTCTNFSNLSLNATSYLWTFAGANPSTSTDVSPTNICYNTPGSYTVSLIATNAITSDTLTLNNYITVYPYPAPQGILQSGDTLIANQGAVSYQWYYNGNIISGATDYFYVADTSGDFNVVATDANNCEVEAAIFDVVASVRTVVGIEQVSIYPNPVKEKLEIRNLKLETSATISIYNVVGARALAVYLTSNIQLPTSIDVRALPSGMYWLEVNTTGKLFRAQFSKQ